MSEIQFGEDLAVGVITVVEDKGVVSFSGEQLLHELQHLDSFGSDGAKESQETEPLISPNR